MARAVGTTVVVVLSFAAGLCTHFLYQRWNPPIIESDGSAVMVQPLGQDLAVIPPQQHKVSFVPLSSELAREEIPVELPSLAARDVEKLRALTGKPARVRGRVFRVGHSAKTNTYFLNFGPSREALTAVIFSSTAELLEKNKLAPNIFENKEVEITGQIKDHPQYGLEVIVENPKQIKIIN
jgi:hypothetical protein